MIQSTGSRVDPFSIDCIDREASKKK
jgi:hypothetical protein